MYASPDLIKGICDEVLKHITPSSEETSRAYELFKIIKSRIEGIVKEFGFPYSITLEGSVVKGTHLRGETDLDIFILIRNDEMSRDWLEELIDGIARILSEYKPRKLYASHPYIRLDVNGMEVDIVPAYMAYSIEEVRTAVDRTPFHTRFIREKLHDEKVNEVRLLKKFFKSINVYGAEIKVEGFSGYLTELLIVYYGSFINTLHGIANWSPPQVLDIDRRFTDVKDYIRIYGEKPLIVPDPVDPRRNAAAAVALRSFSKAVLAARAFLERPSIDFFFPRFPTSSWEVLNDLIEKRQSSIAGYMINYAVGTSPDIIWGELKRSLKRGISVLRSYDFIVIDYGIWCDEVSKALILYEVTPPKLSTYKLHLGPKVFRVNETGKFLSKYLGRSDIVGPWINDYGELVIMKRRKHVTPYEVLMHEAKNVINIKHLISYSVITLNELKQMYLSDDNFKVWLNSFINKKPLWLG